MQNPWAELSPNGGTYLLDVDREQIERYNVVQVEGAKLVLESVPEPFIGNPRTANVVLLLLNPGHSLEDPQAHRDPVFKAALFRNLRQEVQDYPFYPLNPTLSSTPSARWWMPRLRELKEASGLSFAEISKKLLALEWFPYHSKSSGLPTTPVCESQKYTFQLAREMLASKLVIRMRSINHWAQVEPRFSLVPCLKSPRCGYVSKRNTEAGLFDRIVKALKT